MYQLNAVIFVVVVVVMPTRPKRSNDHPNRLIDRSVHLCRANFYTYGFWFDRFSVAYGRRTMQSFYRRCMSHVVCKRYIRSSNFTRCDFGWPINATDTLLSCVFCGSQHTFYLTLVFFVRFYTLAKWLRWLKVKRVCGSIEWFWCWCHCRNIT